jgi:hypothetical protein
MHDEPASEARIVTPGQGKILHAFGDGDHAAARRRHDGRFFEACADEFAKPGEPSMERLGEIVNEYGLRFEDV